jgi:IS5 family transposase
MHPGSLFSLAEHLERLSKDGDPLEVLAGTIEFELFRPLLTKGLGYSDGGKGGRPPFDPVAMFKVLVVQAQHNLSDARMEFMIRDRLSWMRFFGFDLGGAMPDENTIRHYRNRLTESGSLEALMQAFEQQLREAGYLAMGGQIVDATLVQPTQMAHLVPIIAQKSWLLRVSSWPERRRKLADLRESTRNIWR